MRSNRINATRSGLWAMSFAAAMLTASASFAQQQLQEWVCPKGSVVTCDLSGKKLWDFETKGQVASTTFGPNNSVLVTETSFFGFHHGNAIAYRFVDKFAKSTLHALDDKTGKQLWEFATEEHPLSKPLVAGDIILAQAFTLVDWEQENPPSLYALNAKTGAVIWKRQFDFFATREWLAVSDNMVFCVESNYGSIVRILVLDLQTGKLIQRVDLKIQRVNLKESLPEPVYAGNVPTAWLPGKNLFATLTGGGRDSVIAIDTVNGTLKWSRQLEKGQWLSDPTLVKDGNHLYVAANLTGGGRPFLACFDSRTGKPVKKADLEILAHTSPWRVMTSKGRTLAVLTNSSIHKYSDFPIQLVDLSGKKKGEISLDFQNREHLVYAEDNLIYAEARTEGVYKLECFDVETEKLVWMTECGIPPYRFFDKRIYDSDKYDVVNKKTITCLDGKTGDRLWKIDAGGCEVVDVGVDLFLAATDFRWPGQR